MNARYRTAAELAADIEAFLADEPVSAWKEPAAVRAARWVRRHRTLVSTGGATVAVLLLALAIIVVLQSSANRRLTVANNQRESRPQRRGEPARQGAAELPNGAGCRRSLFHPGERRPAACRARAGTVAAGSAEFRRAVLRALRRPGLEKARRSITKTRGPSSGSPPSRRKSPHRPNRPPISSGRPKTSAIWPRPKAARRRVPAKASSCARSISPRFMIAWASVKNRQTALTDALAIARSLVNEYPNLAPAKHLLARCLGARGTFAARTGEPRGGRRSVRGRNPSPRTARSNAATAANLSNRIGRGVSQSGRRRAAVRTS